MRRSTIWLLSLLLALACNRTGADAKASFTADAAMNGGFPGSPRLTGKLYLSDGHLRVDWGPFADVFDLKQRKGWRIVPETHTYQDLADKDLTTYAPETTNGSIMNGRMANKWDVLNPHGFHLADLSIVDSRSNRALGAPPQP